MSDFKAKMHQIGFPLGFRWCSLQRSRDFLAVFKGPTSIWQELRFAIPKGRYLQP